MPRTNTSSEFVSAAGKVFELIKKLSDEVRNLGGSDEDLRRILSDSSLTRQLAELIVGSNANVFPLVIDYTQSLAEMVATGKYSAGAVNTNITEEHFPVETGEANVQSVLVHLDRTVDSDQVLRELDKRGLRPATMVELLAFGAQHPDAQRQFPIVALGSVWADPDDDRRVGCLWGRPASRELHLSWFDGQWGAHCRFLAVRK